MRQGLLIVAGLLVVAAAWVVVAGRWRYTTPPVTMIRLVPPLPAASTDVDVSVLDLLVETRQAVVRDVTAADAWSDYGQVLHANEFHDDARHCYEASLQLDADRARAWYYLGLLHTRAGETDAALRAFSNAATSADDYAPAFWRQGLIHLDAAASSDGLASAEAAFRRALAVDSTAAAARIGLARVALARGDDAEAVDILVAPDIASGRSAGYARHLLASAYRRLGRIDDARAAAGRAGDARPAWSDPWEQALADRRPGYGARIERATAFIEAGRIPAAIEMLEALRQERSGSATVLVNLGLAYRSAGRLRESVEVLRQAVALDASFFPAHFQLAAAYAEVSGQPGTERADVWRTQARGHLDRVLDLNPTYAAAFSLQGDLDRLEQRTESALKSYQEAERCDGADARWPFRRGVVLLELSRWDEAISALERATTLDPDRSEPWRALGVGLTNARRFDEAAAALDHARTLSPDDSRIAASIDHLRQARKVATP